MRFGPLMPLFGATPSRLGADDPFSRLQREMNRLFDDLYRGVPAAEEWGKRTAWAPRVDVQEDKDALKVTADLPGVDEKDVECTLENDVLTIKGEKKSEREQEEKGYYLAERTYGSFYRAISLPFDVDRDKVEASFANGVLTIRLPKAAQESQAQKKIAIKSGESGPAPKAA